MHEAFESNSSLEPVVNSLGRIQSQIQALMEMEKSWRDELDMEQLQELIKRKRQLIDNIQHLIRDQQNLEMELVESSGEALPSQYKDYRDNQVAAIHQMLENIINLHQSHEQKLQQRASTLKLNLEEVQQAIALVKAYHVQKPNQARHIDLAG